MAGLWSTALSLAKLGPGRRPYMPAAMRARCCSRVSCPSSRSTSSTTRPAFLASAGGASSGPPVSASCRSPSQAWPLAISSRVQCGTRGSPAAGSCSLSISAGAGTTPGALEIHSCLSENPRPDRNMGNRHAARRRKQVNEGQTMTAQTLRYLVAFALVVVGAGAFLATRSHSEASTTVEALARETHFHGIAVDSSDPDRLYLATHHGLYAVAPDGSATRLSPVQDFMGFTPHPTDPSLLYASGHPASGGNLGFIASEDAGRSWHQLAEGVGGPVDFHQMDVSVSDPKTIYGAHGGNLQLSRDGGQTWEVVAPAPEGLIDLA